MLFVTKDLTFVNIWVLRPHTMLSLNSFRNKNYKMQVKTKMLLKDNIQRLSFRNKTSIKLKVFEI